MDTAPEFSKLPPQDERRKIMLGTIIRVAAIITVLAVFIPIAIGIHRTSKRNDDSQKLRDIGQAMLAFAFNTTKGVLPSDADAYLPPRLLSPPRDVYQVAVTLAHKDEAMNNPAIWFSSMDSAFPLPSQLPTVLDPTYKGNKRNAPINPKFANALLAFAVAIFPSGQGNIRLPGWTPLAWTRGLQPDGTWSKMLGTYGDWGGFITFVGGNTEKYESIGGRLMKFGTNVPTSNILEALPPGSHISEFTPPKKCGWVFRR